MPRLHCVSLEHHFFESTCTLCHNRFGRTVWSRADSHTHRIQHLCGDDLIGAMGLELGMLRRMPRPVS